MVSDNIHQSGRTFQIVTPGAESLVDGEELLIMGIVVEFRRGQSPRAECNWTDLTILTMDGDDTGYGVVRGIGFHNNGMVQQPMSQNGGGSEGVFEALESNVTVIREGPSVRMGSNRGRTYKRARDAASATQAERCALHHHACPVFVGQKLAALSWRKGGT